MTKADLNKKWSKYCDTDRLVDSVRTLLIEHKHVNTEHGVCTLLDKYFQAKAPLIEMFMRSKHYIGNMRISFEKEFDRGLDKDAIWDFCEKFVNNMKVEQILQEVDEDGKRMFDYLMAGKNIFDISGLPNEKEQTDILAKIRRFSYDKQTTCSSQEKFNEFTAYIWEFRRIYSSTMPFDLTVNSDKKEIPLLKAGTKTSRAFNKVCSYYGVDKFNPEEVTVERNGETITKTIYPYDKLFATYSDLVSCLTRNMSFVISLNPLDYLTMSHGISWQSCHNIRSGSWMGGTLSYMLDPSSIVTFVVDNLDGNIHESGKYYRQMFHYKNGLFIQNRLYPQGNDGATNLYDKFRGFMIEEFAGILDVEGEWDAQSGAKICTAHISDDKGVHYRDYKHNNSCSIFYPHAIEDEALNQKVTIGADGICVNCGAVHTLSGRLNHKYKADCARYDGG